MGFLPALILGLFVVLFQKSKTMLSAKIKIGIMLALEFLFFLVLIFTFFDGSIPPSLLVMSVLTVLGLGAFTGWKIYKAYLQIKNNDFPNDDKEE